MASGAAGMVFVAGAASGELAAGGGATTGATGSAVDALDADRAAITPGAGIASL